MTTLRFVGADHRWLLETLVDACETTEREGARPSVIVNGTTYAEYELLKVAFLLPEENLQMHHEVMLEGIFKARQSGYRRAGINLANLANVTAFATRSVGARKILAEMRRNQRS
jgi:hypothetical protein